MLWQMIFGSGANSPDPSDPVSRGYKRFFRKIRNLVIVVLAIAAAIVLLGVPSIQGDYRYPGGITGTPGAMDKTDADYWNPSGWQTVQAGEYSPGCPVIIFMPLRKCMDLKPYKNDVTTRIFGEEFFDGP